MQGLSSYIFLFERMPIIAKAATNIDILSNYTKLYVYFRSCYEVTNCKQSLAGRTSHCASMQIPAWPRNGGTDRILWNVTSARSRKPKEKRKKQKILHIGKNVISLQSDSRRVLSTNTRETSLKGNGKGKYSGCGAVG